MANYIVNAYNNGGSDGSVNMRSDPAKPTELGAHVPYGATSCEVGRDVMGATFENIEFQSIHLMRGGTATAAETAAEAAFQSTHLMRGGTAEVTNRYRVLTGDF